MFTSNQNASLGEIGKRKRIQVSEFDDDHSTCARPADFVSDCSTSRWVFGKGKEEDENYFDMMSR